MPASTVQARCSCTTADGHSNLNTTVGATCDLSCPQLSALLSIAANLGCRRGADQLVQALELGQHHGEEQQQQQQGDGSSGAVLLTCVDFDGWNTSSMEPQVGFCGHRAQGQDAEGRGFYCAHCKLLSLKLRVRGMGGGRASGARPFCTARTWLGPLALAGTVFLDPTIRPLAAGSAPCVAAATSRAEDSAHPILQHSICRTWCR